MYQPTIITWIIILFGLLTCLPLLFAQLLAIIEPHGKRAKDILIGTGEEWRDVTHFKSAYSLAMTDWIVFFPIFILSIIGIISSSSLGYILLAVSGAIQVYINVFLWFIEKEYVNPSNGPLKYYSYLWGNFIYWGSASFLYGIFRINGINF